MRDGESSRASSRPSSPEDGGHDHVAIGLEGPLQQLLRIRIVVDDEDRVDPVRNQPLLPVVDLGHGLRRLEGVHRGRQLDGEGRSLAELRADGDVATHHLAEASADGQTETGAAEVPGGRVIGLGELLEDVLQLVGGDADAGVADRQEDPVAAVSPLVGGRSG